MDEKEKEIEEYFDTYIKPYLIDGNKLKCKRCGRIAQYHNKESIVTHIKNLKGVLICGVCVPPVKNVENKWIWNLFEVIIVDDKKDGRQFPTRGTGRVIIVRTTKKVIEDYAFELDNIGMNITEDKAIELAKRYAGMTTVEITSHKSILSSKVGYSERVSDVKAEINEIIERD